MGMKADNEYEFTGKINDSGEVKTTWQDRKSLLRLFANEDEVEVVVRRKRKKRSLNANAYYHGVVVDMIREGMEAEGNEVDHDEVHIYMRYKYLNETKTTASGKVFTVCKSTTKLNTTEFALYVDKCIHFAMEYLNISIPPPHKVTDKYTFPWFIGLTETHATYANRIAEHLQDIFHIDDLARYFRQNPAWEADVVIKQLFSERKKEIALGV